MIGLLFVVYLVFRINDFCLAVCASNRFKSNKHFKCIPSTFDIYIYEIIAILIKCDRPNFSLAFDFQIISF